MIDLGDVQHLSVIIRDSNGAPADAGAVVLTITLPDGTSSTPAVSHDGVGLYSSDYTPTLAGRHLVRWVATGANASAYTDVFNVTSTAPRLLIGLEEARLGIGAQSSTARDNDLRTLIASVTPIMEDICGPILSAAKDEWYDGGARTVRLNYAPIISVQTVSESYGNFVRTLTDQPLDGSSFDAYGYTVDLVDGLLHRRASGRTGIFQPGRRNVRVSYTAGRSVIPDNILYATRRLVRFLWQQEQQGLGRPEFGTADATPMVTTPSGFLVPRVVVEACASEVRTVGIA